MERRIHDYWVTVQPFACALRNWWFRTAIPGLAGLLCYPRLPVSPSTGVGIFKALKPLAAANQMSQGPGVSAGEIFALRLPC